MGMQAMDAHTLRVLEFDKVLDRAAAFAVSQQGREAVASLRPLQDKSSAKREIDLVTEACDIIAEHGRVPLDGLFDIRDWLKALRPEGAILDGAALRQIASTLGAGRILRDFTARLSKLRPEFAAMVAELRVYPEIEREINRAIDPDGRVLDSASPDLRDIRAEIREIDGKIRDLLDRFIQ